MKKAAPKYYTGKVHTVIFEKPPSFNILKVVLDEECAPQSGSPLETFGFGAGDDNLNNRRRNIPFTIAEERIVTVKGHVLGMKIQQGDWFGFEAKWVNDKKYGRQLQITKAPVYKDTFKPETAISMLTANGISRTVCEALCQHFGDDNFVAVLKDANALEESGIVDQTLAQMITQRWEKVRARLTTISDLVDLGVSRSSLNAAWKQFGDEASQIISKNPWVMSSFRGVSFSSLDKIANQLGIDLECSDRLKGAILYKLRTMRTQTGSTCLDPVVLQKEVNRIASCPDDKYVEALKELHKEGSLVVSRVEGRRFVYEPWFHEIETLSAELLKDRVAVVQRDRDETRARDMCLELLEDDVKAKLGADPSFRDAAAALVGTVSGKSQIVLSSEQMRGIVNAIVEPISILTGLPGSGKTTSLKILVEVLDMLSANYLLTAPTGIAAKRITATTHKPAQTVHRAFAAGLPTESIEGRAVSYEGVLASSSGADTDGSESEWGYGKGQPHPARLVVVDESSMVDLALLYRLLTCTSNNCRLVFVGDAHQLPSVGAGNVLRDLIQSGTFPVVSLTQIFRQADTSSIVTAAHAIVGGQVPDTDPRSDFALWPVESEDQVAETIVRIAGKLKSKREEFQVISPRHGGTIGVTALNKMLRRALNPSMPGVSEVSIMGWSVRRGDRIMVCRNDYNLGIYNGDVGKVESTDIRRRQVKVKIYDNPPKIIDLDFGEVHRLLRMAYACTVHKVQGLEYDNIVMPIVSSFGLQLQRNLLYTAVTRARERVILVGTRKALARAVGNDRQDYRETCLVERLK